MLPTQPTRLTLLLIAALVALGPLAIDMYLPAFPAIARAFASDVGAVQQTLTLYFIGFAVAQLIHGPLSDRYGRRPVLLVGLLLFIVSSIGVTFSHSIEGLGLWRVLQAVGGSAGPVLGRAMVRDLFPPQQAARQMALIGSVIALAPAVAPILGGYLTVWYGWVAIFWCLSGYALLVMIGFWRYLPETAPLSRRHPLRVRQLVGRYLELLRHPLWRGYTLCSSFAFGGVFAFLSGAPFVIISYYGFAAEQFGLFFTVVVMGFIIGSLVGGRLVMHLGIDRLLNYGSSIVALMGMVMLLLAQLEAPSIWTIILPQSLYMIGVGLVMPQAMAGALGPFPHMAGSASALFGFMQMGLSAMVGSTVAAFNSDSPAVMVVVIAVMGLSTRMAIISLRRYQRTHKIEGVEETI